MRPVLFRVGAFEVHSYSAMLCLGIMLGMVAQQRVAVFYGLDVARVSLALLVLLAPALAGARMLYVLEHWSEYRVAWRRVARPWEGGAAMYGGFVVGLLLAVPVLRALGLPYGAFWDTTSFTMLVGMVVTRVGCQLAGCCAGRATDGWWGFVLPDQRGVWRRRFPTQALEAALGIVVLGGAIGLLRARLAPGALFLFVVCAYSLGRIALEGTREASAFGRRLHTSLSAVFIASSIVAFLTAWRH